MWRRWQSELVSLLSHDRGAVLTDGGGGDRVSASVVDTSLSRLRDPGAQRLFLLLGPCPAHTQCTTHTVHRPSVHY